MKVFLLCKHDANESGYQTKHIFRNLKDAYNCAIIYENIKDRKFIETELQKVLNCLKINTCCTFLELDDIFYEITRLTLH